MCVNIHIYSVNSESSEQVDCIIFITLLTLRIVFMSISVLTKGMSCLFFCFCACCMNAQVRNTDPVRHLRISGYLGQRIDACIEYRVKAQDVDHLVEPFRHKEETSRWQSEFWGNGYKGRSPHTVMIKILSCTRLLRMERSC